MYASLHAIGEVVEIEGTAVTRSIAVGPTPAAIAITHDGRIFVTQQHGQNVTYEIVPQRRGHHHQGGHFRHVTRHEHATRGRH